MTKRIYVYQTEQHALGDIAAHIIAWCKKQPGCGLGGATGNSPMKMWRRIWDQLSEAPPADREALLSQEVVFLDSYFSGLTYSHWAWRNLRVGRPGGFDPRNVYLPRSCFYEGQRLVTNARLLQVLDECRDQWEARTEPGEGNAPPPEVRIKQNATHPVLVEIRKSLQQYDDLVRAHSQRLQILGIGVGGAIAHDEQSGGHLAFLEHGSAARETGTVLVRLAESTRQQNEADWGVTAENSEPTMEPAQFAISQGVSSLLDHTSGLVLLAWGEKKNMAVRRMFFGVPGPKNAAAWVQGHPNVTVYLDCAAFAGLNEQQLSERGWAVEFVE